MTRGKLPAVQAGANAYGRSRIGCMADRLQVSRASRRQQQLAEEFARLVERLIEPWMFWDGWALHVGCDRCADQGAEAACWGRAGCHDFERGCGCRTCAAEQQRAMARAGGER